MANGSPNAHYEEEPPEGSAPEAGETRSSGSRRRTAANRVTLTPQEVAALLQGLSQGAASSWAAATSSNFWEPLVPGRWSGRGSLSWQKIYGWWDAITAYRRQIMRG